MRLKKGSGIMSKTLYEKIWDLHIVDQEENKPAIIYIDLHLVHEVTSPQLLKDLGWQIERSGDLI